MRIIKSIASSLIKGIIIVQNQFKLKINIRLKRDVQNLVVISNTKVALTLEQRDFIKKHFLNAKQKTLKLPI